MQVFLQALNGYLATTLPHPQRLRDDGRNQCGITHCGEGNKTHAARKALGDFTRHLQPQTGFSDPAWSSKRYQAHIVSQQHSLHGSDFPIATNKCRSLGGKIALLRRGMSRWRFGEPVAYGRKISGQITGGCVAFLGILGQAAFDYPAKWRWNLGG